MMFECDIFQTPLYSKFILALNGVRVAFEQSSVIDEQFLSEHLFYLSKHNWKPKGNS